MPKILPFIECTYWACQYKAIRFAQDTLTGKVEQCCTKTNKNLNHWPYSKAPDWCPRRHEAIDGAKKN